uniref:FBA_2 domain-containing protein n=3 Tax=Caenorhabditis tropicalis TaxID=1561998 RepID=A0A1I7TZ32_9PELO
MHRLRPSYCNLVTRTTFDRKVCVEIVFSEHVKLTWMFSKCFTKKMMVPGEVISARKIDGTVLETSCKCSSINTIITFSAPLESSFQLVTSYLLYLFPCPIRKFELDMKFFSNLTSFSKLITVEKCEMLTLRAGKSSKENVEKVLNSFDGFKYFEMIGYVGEGIACEKMNGLDVLKTNDAIWLPTNIFMKLDCRKIEIGENDYLPSDINKFIKKWLNYGFENLEYLIVHMEELFEEEIEMILGDVFVEDWDPKIRHGYYRTNKTTLYDCRKGHDIIRADGKISLSLTECFTLETQSNRSSRPNISSQPFFEAMKK